MSKDKAEWSGFDTALVIIFGVVISAAIYFVGREGAWTDGYCTALGGERIGQYMCEVDGQVVRP